MTQQLGLVTVLVTTMTKPSPFMSASSASACEKIANSRRRRDGLWLCRKTADAALLLAKAINGRQAEAVGNQTGGRVFLFLETDDFKRDHAAFRERGVRFVEEPRKETYGMVAVFDDLYGNRWDLIEPK